MFKKCQSITVALILTGLLSVSFVLGIPLAVAGMDAIDDRHEELLDGLAHYTWQRLNEARTNPAAVLERLGLSVQDVARVLGEDGWIIDQGLAPLAWNNHLTVAATAHGRDMFDRIYYGHQSPEGEGPYARIAATGYDARLEDETLAALAFSNYLEIETALTAMIDMMLRDELIGTDGVSRNIFSTELSDVGIALFAESVKLLEGQPYVYLLVIDFASPIEPQYYLVGKAEVADRLALRNNYTGFWEIFTPSPDAVFQIAYPWEGGTLAVFSPQWEARSKIDVPAFPTANRFINLRNQAVD